MIPDSLTPLYPADLAPETDHAKPLEIGIAFSAICKLSESGAPGGPAITVLEACAPAYANLPDGISSLFM